MSEKKEEKLYPIHLTEDEGRAMLYTFHEIDSEYGFDYDREEAEPMELEQKFIDAFPEIAADQKRKRDFDRIWHNEIDMDDGMIALERSQRAEFGQYMAAREKKDGKQWATNLNDPEYQRVEQLQQNIMGHRINLLRDKYPEMTDLVEEEYSHWLDLANSLRDDKNNHEIANALKEFGPDWRL